MTPLRRSFLFGAWLGWQIESNWADPFLFAVYSIAKPVASALILVVMYTVVTGGAIDQPVFPYIYLGNSFYIYVYMVMTGVSWAVIDDREHYRTLKYVYVAPLVIPVYLLGRGMARFAIGTISVIITLTVGVLWLKVPLNLAAADWPLFLGTLVLGIYTLSMMGLILAGVAMLIANHVWFLGDAVAGALFLFSGAIFPLDVLPAWLRPVGFALPVTYWLELIRRALLGSAAEAFPTLAGLSNGQLLAVLAGMAVMLTGLALVLFRWCEFMARERGMLDMVTNY